MESKDFFSSLRFQHSESGEWSHAEASPLEEAEKAFVFPAAEVLPHPRSILEVGFGRGVNSAVALRYLGREKPSLACTFGGIEPFPELLHPWPPLLPDWSEYFPWWGKLESSWHSKAHRGAISTAPFPGHCPPVPGGWDWIFVDLFSPGAHPQDWGDSWASVLAAHASPHAVLTTYCCARSVRERLQQAGWGVEILRSKGYRDTLRAQRCTPLPISA